MDPADPPQKPYLFEQHFFAAENTDITGFTGALEDRGFVIDTIAYDPDQPARAWRVIAIKVDLLEERRVLALSDEMDGLARQFGIAYDGWLTRVE